MKQLVTLIMLGGCGLGPTHPSAGGDPDVVDAAIADDAEADASAEAPAPSAWRSQVLYLVMPDRFRDGNPGNNDLGTPQCFDRTKPQKFHGGDLAGLRSQLAYVRALGASTVWITPPNRQVAEGAGCGYHGYWIDYTDPPDDALEPRLGTPAELDALVTDMHASGMRLVVDMVVNHAGNAARLPTQHADWFHDPATCGQLGPAQIWCPLDRHPDFAQERPVVASYLSALEARMVTRYHVDGIRMDTAKHVLPGYFRDSFFPAVRAANPALYSVAEVFDEGSLAAAVPYLDAGFTSVFHFPLRRALVDAIAHAGTIDRVAQAVADGIAKVGVQRALDLTLFVDNHDVPRFANEPGFGVPEATIRRRLMLALDLIFTLPGVPQLYYGDELGMYGAADPDNRRDLPGWATDAAGRAQPHPGEAVAGSAQVFDRVHALASLRRTLPSLAAGAYHELWRQNGAANPNVFAFSRGTDTIVVVNNGGGAATVRIPVHGIADGVVLTDVLGDGGPATVKVTGGAIALTLPPLTASLLRTP